MMKLCQSSLSSYSSGPTGRASQDSGWTWSFSEWSDRITGIGAKRNGLDLLEMRSDEIDRADRTGNSQGGPGGAASRGGGNFGSDGSNNK